jgi:hypothetical protein
MNSIGMLDLAWVKIPPALRVSGARQYPPTIKLLCLTFDFQDAAVVPDQEWNA